MTQLSEIQKLFLDQARQKKRKLGIGIIRTPDEVVNSLRQTTAYADITVVGSKIEGFDCLPTKDDDEASHELIKLLKEGKIEGFVRGQIKDSYTHKVYLEVFGLPEPLYKVCPVTVAKNEHWFTITSASNYNALTQEQKNHEVLRAAEWLKELGFEPKIGITSTRRLTGRVGEFGLLEEIAKRCEETANYIRQKGYDVKEYYIEYEKAVWGDRNLIVPSIGIIGNPWAKSLVYFGGWTNVCCPMLDEGAYYEDSARNNINWFWPVVSTVAWINREKK